MRKPKCKQCKKSDKIVYSIYGDKVAPVWEGYECERCWCVVKEVFNAEKNYV